MLQIFWQVATDLTKKTYFGLYIFESYKYRNDRICNLVRIMTSTRFVTTFLSQKSTFFDFLLVILTSPSKK